MSSVSSDGRVELTASGAWTAVHARQLELLVEAASREYQPAGPATIDLRGVVEFDTYGAWLLERFVRTCQQRGSDVRIATTHGAFARLSVRRWRQGWNLIVGRSQPAMI